MSDIRILLDEHVWHGLIKIGQEIGVDVLPVQEILAEGTADEEVLVFASRERRMVITGNTNDFARLAAQWYSEEREHWGILIIPGQTDRSLLSRGLRTIAANHTADYFRNTFRFIQEFIHRSDS
jgi:predicted nuclease of predicted toxin-antitoxin system